MLVDLHMHTTRSDGVWAPERLFDEIRARDLAYFCVSDHDNLEAYPMPEDLRARSIAGLEVDAHHGGHTTHLLAYGVESRESPLLQALERQRVARERRMEQMIERCNALGLEVGFDEVRAQAAGASSLGRPHLARVLLARGYVSSVQEAFDKYLADEGEGYVALERLTSDRAIDLIHDSGGVAVVAHPKRLRSAGHLAELADLGVDGVEIKHPTADEADERGYRAFAAERGLLTTGGTDFHAPVEGRPIGIELSQMEIDALRLAIARRR